MAGVYDLLFGSDEDHARQQRAMAMRQQLRGDTGLPGRPSPPSEPWPNPYGEPPPESPGVSGSWGDIPGQWGGEGRARPPSAPGPQGPAQAPGGPQARPQGGGGGYAAAGASGGAGGAPGAPGAGGGVDPSDARMQSLMQQYTDAMKPPDHAKAQDAYAKRAEQGGSHLLLAIAAQRAGQDQQPLQAHYLKQAAAAREPMKMAGGTMTETGFIEDPGYQQEFKIKQLNARIAQEQQIQNSNAARQDKIDSQNRMFQHQREMAEMQRSFAASMAGQASADRRYAAELAHGGKAGAGGKGQYDNRTILNLAQEAKKLIPGSTGGFVGNMVDQVAGAANIGLPGAKAIGELKTLSGRLIMAMPRMEGPQSDRDTQLYREMAGDLANPNTPVSVRLQTVDRIIDLAKKYESGYWAPPGYKAPGGWDYQGSTP